MAEWLVLHRNCVFSFGSLNIYWQSYVLLLDKEKDKVQFLTESTNVVFINQIPLILSKISSVSRIVKISTSFMDVWLENFICKIVEVGNTRGKLTCRREDTPEFFLSLTELT